MPVAVAVVLTGRPRSRAFPITYNLGCNFMPADKARALMHVVAWDRVEGTDTYCKYVRIEKRAEGSAYEVLLLVQIWFGGPSGFDDQRKTFKQQVGSAGIHDLAGLGVRAFVVSATETLKNSAHLIAQKDRAILNVFIGVGPDQNAEAIARQLAIAFAAT